MRDWTYLPSQISHLFAAADSRRSPDLQSSSFICVCSSSCMIDLNEDSAIVYMHLICNFFPSFSLLFCKQISRTCGGSSSLAPSYSFGDDDGSSCSLSIIFGDHLIRYTVVSTSLTSECRHDNSIF